MDIFSATLIDTKRYTQEQQPKNQTSILAQRINQIHEGNPSEAQARYAKLFWTAPISLNPMDVKRTAHDSEINIRYACLAKKHDEKVASFLLGQVFLADDSQHGVVANKEQAIQHLGKAFDQGFQPAEDSLISLYSSAPHVSENGFIDVAPDFAYKVLTQAAQHKSPTAHFLLGAMHLFIDENKGDEDTFDHFALALDHLKVAFNLGHNQWNLTDTESEKICERAMELVNAGKKSEAITLYEIAAASGNQHARAELGSVKKPRHEPGFFDLFFRNQAQHRHITALNINK